MNRTTVIQRYSEAIAPYYKPHGLVEVWATGSKKKWTRIRIENISAWTEAVGNTDVHCTLQQFKIHPTPFEGKDKHSEPYIAPIFFEFDASEKRGTTLEDSRKDAMKLCTFIINSVNPAKGVLRIWYSGSRGFHITIDPRMFGILPDPELHMFYKVIAFHYAELLNLKTLDEQVYSVRRTFRLPDSKRSTQWERGKGDLVDQHKVEIEFNELDMMSVDEIRELGSEPRGALYSDEELASIEFNPDSTKWLRHAYQEFQNEKRLKNTSNKTKVVIKAADDQSFPICIKAILEYEFATDKRNKACLSLLCFLNDSGRSYDDSWAIIEEWTRGIPWDTKKEEERVANARAIMRRVFTEDSIYNFECQFIRSCAGVNNSNNEVSIPCLYNNCKFVESSETSSSDAPRIELQEFIRPEYNRTPCKAYAHLIGFMDRAFSVPAQVRLSCPHILSDGNTHLVLCDTCAMPSTSEQISSEDTHGQALSRTMEINLLRNGLALIDVTSKMKKGMIRSLTGIHPKCQSWRMEEVQSATIRQVMLKPPSIDESSSSVWDAESFEAKKQVGFLATREEDSILSKENTEVEIVAMPMASPKDQSIHLAISGMTSSESDLDKFTVTDELKEQLYSIHAVKEGDTVEGKVFDRIQKIASHIGIRGRDELILAMDLVFHSTMAVKLSEKDIEERGWMQLLVVGDPGQGKSSISKSLMRHYNLGRSIECGGASRTGIVYSIDITKYGKMLVWGVLPQEDRRLVVIDEFHQLDAEDLEMMTGMRSSGIVKVNRIVSGTTLCRTRMIFLANPPGDGKLDGYSFGIKAINAVMTKQQDIRRLDLASICRSGDVSLEDLNKVSTDGDYGEYEPNSCKNLILWAWTRKTEHIKWTEQAVTTLMKQSIDIARWLECDISLAEGSDMRFRLARIAQSVAAMCYSSDSEGENLWIKPEHVEFAADVFVQLSTSVGKMNLHVYAKSWQARNTLTDKQREDLGRTLTGNTWFLVFCDHMLTHDFFRKEDVSVLVDMDVEDFKELWKFLIRSNMIEQAKGGRGFRKNPKFTLWLGEHIKGMKPEEISNSVTLSGDQYLGDAEYE